MDDQKNSKYSRTPELKDLISLCDSLNKAGVRYMLIGGCAVILHGFARGTKDIDLLVDSTPDNIKRIKKALSILPDNAIAQIEDDEIQKYSVVRIADEIVVDLMAKACGIDYNEASTDIEIKEINGVKIPIANKELLLRMKDTVRPSDKMDSEFLKALIDDMKGQKKKIR